MQVRSILLNLIVLLILIAGCLVGRGSAGEGVIPAGEATPVGLSTQSVASGQYLPLVFRPTPPVEPTPPPRSGALRINIPYFNSEVAYSETAILWFGKVNPTENYVDVRLGYSEDELFVHLAVFDRLLWYDDSSPIDLEAWDSASLYLDMDGVQGYAPDGSSYRFVGSLNFWEEDADYQAVYQGNGSGWRESNISFTSQIGYRGNPNNDARDNGWRLSYWIPFSSLGLESAPPQGTMGVGSGIT